MGSELQQAFDEAWAQEGVPRPHYEALLHALMEADPAALARSVTRSMVEQGALFGGSPFVVDPVPRLFTLEEWHLLENGLAQRTRALNHFLLDAYGSQRIVADGRVPRAVITSAEGFEADLVGRMPSHAWPAAIIGFDVVRAPSGEFLVLEDNLRTPSGFAYAVAARAAVLGAIPRGLSEPRPLEPVVWDLLAAAIHAATPDSTSNPTVVVLTDGPDNVAYYEHALASEMLGAALATPDQLVRQGTEVGMRDAAGVWQPVDVVYRRTNEDRARDGHGQLTDVGEKLLEPWLDGRIGLINAFGNGVADDKLVHTHVEDFIDFYLGEDPLIRSVPTTAVSADPGNVVGRLDELVVKPRHSHGGIGVVVGPHARREDLDRLAEVLHGDPTGYVAQPTVTLSVHPTVVEGRLMPRHVDLRPFSFAAEEVSLLPGGLSRVALGEGALVVNTSQDGGGKDTWVMDEPATAPPRVDTAPRRSG